jgi:hypothetical protein
MQEGAVVGVGRKYGLKPVPFKRVPFNSVVRSRSFDSLRFASVAQDDIGVRKYGPKPVSSRECPSTAL